MLTLDLEVWRQQPDVRDSYVARVSVIKLNHHRVQVFLIARSTCNGACPACVASPAKQKAGAGRRATGVLSRAFLKPYYTGSLANQISTRGLRSFRATLHFGGQAGSGWGLRWGGVALIGSPVLHPLVPHTGRHTLRTYTGVKTCLHFLPDVSNRLWPICLVVRRPLFSPVARGHAVLSRCAGVDISYNPGTGFWVLG